MADALREPVDVVVIGAGPNGLAAAIEVARAGCSVLVLEAGDTVGGGTRSAELTGPGFVHDVCSAIHPLAAGSPFFAGVPLAEHGCELVHPELPLVHPVDGGGAGVLHRSLDATAAEAGVDGPAWRRLYGPIVERWDDIDDQVLGPVLRVPRHPISMARFGVHAVRSAGSVAGRFRTDEVRGMFAGLAAHSFLPLEHRLTASFGLLLGGLAHVHGWPVVRGGSQRLADALASYLVALGGTVVTGHRVTSLDELPPHRAVLVDVTPSQLVALAGDRLSSRGRRRYRRFRHGPGACKVDFALSGPVPWENEAARRAGCLHLGGTFEEVAAAEREVAAGGHPERPFVLVGQQSLVDDTRAPEGQHTLWTYAHVPNGSTLDVSAQITAQIERFAPGFRDLVLDAHVMTAADLEAYNPSYVGGDIGGGGHGGLQLVLRPVASLDPYATPLDGVFLCSASTPPGGGVHGMCGARAARSALRSLGVPSP
ncbi:MAG: phytoene desaturase family protein [Acidimicrobiia bacterium]